jgi:membrane-associated phospholipid phosphatase
MNWETSIVKSWNTWGASHLSLVKFIANDFVYLAIALGLATFLYSQIKHSTKPFLSALNIRITIAEGLLGVAFPVIVATVLSEILSKLFDRARPFVAHPDIKLLFPHGTDGGFPSHHMVFTMALAVCVLSFHRNIGTILVIMTVLSGIFRVVAGIHYPTDIFVGILIGAIIPPLFKKFLDLLHISLKR